MKITLSSCKYSLGLVLALQINCTRPHSTIANSVENTNTSSSHSPYDPINSELLQEAEAIALNIQQHVVKPQSNLYSELRQLPLSSQQILDLIEQSRTFTSLDKVAANFTFLSKWEMTPEDSQTEQAEPVELKELRELEFLISETSSLHAQIKPDGWHVKLEEHPIKKELRSYYGSVSSSLWESATQSGMEPSLIVQMTEIFAWQVDFSREVQPGDQWRLVVEEHFVRDNAIGWGSILAAEYVKQGETYTAVRYPQQGPNGSYYSPDGQSLRLMFLKSPIKFGRISSRFSQRRFHPILKENRPHLGVDYAAPVGTPIRTVGKGRVVYVGYNGGSGNMVKIRHNSVYETAYLHLSGFAKGLRRGNTVEQGQIIGYVGQTGLATGPHLHFSFYENGRYVDPLGRRFPAADPVPDSQMSEFRSSIVEILPLLPDWRLAMQQEKVGPGH